MKILVNIFWVFLLLLKFNVLLADDKPIAPFKTPIRIVASVNNPPFSFVLPDGTQTGLYVEFWKMWSEINGIPIEIKMTRLEKGLLLVKDKQAIHAGLFYNEERAKWADFSIPIHQVDTGVLYSRNFNKTDKLNKQKNIIVAAHPGSFQADYIKNKFPHLNLITDISNDLIFNQLLKEEVHALVAEIPFMKSQLARRGLNGVFTLSNEVLVSNRVHAIIAKGQTELLEVINSGIENIPIKLLVDLEKKWLPTLDPFFKEQESLPMLTKSEEKWLINHPNLSLGVDTNWYPFDFSNNNGQFSGIAADYIKHASDVLNINFEPVKGLSWKQSLDSTLAGKVDVMAAIAITEERKKILDFTQAYFTAPIVIVTNKHSFYANSMKSLKGKTLGIVKGFAMNDWIGKDFPEIKVQPVDSIVDGLIKVNSGEIDAYTGAIAVINYEIEKRKLYNIQISAFAPYDFEIAMAVRKGLEPLIPILNKVFSNMSENKKAAIANNWLAIRVETGTQLSTVFFIGAPIVLFLMGIIFLITRLNKRLSNEITNRIGIEKELKHLAQHDELTGLANWRLFEELSHIEMNECESTNKRQAFLFVDIDGFKFVNDTYGHKTGDLLLIAIANRLRSCLGENKMIARLGGDEFIIYLSDNISEQKTHNIASKILITLAEPFNLESIQVSVSASIGISLAPQDGKDIETLIQKADAAMYEAKKSGKNTYKVYQQQ